MPGMAEPAFAALAGHLRETTRAAHRALDHHPLLAPLVRPGLGTEDYARALAALHGPHAALEALLAGFAPAEDFPPRLPDLDADLAALGVAPGYLRIETPAPADNAARIGLMYVIEGSNLGAAVIARQLATSLPPAAPRAFFAGFGGTARWQRFWRFTAPHCPPGTHDSVAASACAAFAFYRRHLDDCLARQGAVLPASTFEKVISASTPG